MKELLVPFFESEIAEIHWWETHLEAVEDNLAEAIQSGAARRGTTARVLVEARKPLEGVFRSLKIRLLEEDLELSRQQAEERGMSHQNYIAAILHEALARRRRK